MARALLVLGGGTAGWLTGPAFGISAAALLKASPKLRTGVATGLVGGGAGLPARLRGAFSPLDGSAVVDGELVLLVFATRRVSMSSSCCGDPPAPF